MPAEDLDHDALVSQLRAIGVRSGDRLVVHSSLRALGDVAGGANAVVEALVSAVGPHGTLVLPAFTYHVEPGRPFDPMTTPCRTGAIPEAARRRTGAARSLHPTHSVIASGADAADFVRPHLQARAVGIDSPLDVVAQRGGRVLLLGVAQTANTTIHVGEERVGIPKPPSPTDPSTALVRLPDGQVVEHGLDSSPSCSAAFNTAEAGFRARGVIRDGRIGQALAQLMDSGSMVDAVVELLDADPAALVCNRIACGPCARTRAALGKA